MATIRKRGDKYQIRVSCGYDAQGRHRERSMTWTPPPGMSARAIKSELMRQVVAFEDAADAAGGAVKLAEFVERYFAECVNDGRMKETTRTKYRQVSVRLIEHMGHMRLAKITRGDVQRYVVWLEQPGQRRSPGGAPDGRLSRKSVEHHLSFLSAVLDYAQLLGLISANPCEGIRPSIRRADPAQSYELETVQQLIRAMEQDAPLVRYCFFVLLAHTGLRKGEALGLRWQDVDLTARVLSISQEMEHTAGAGDYIDTPKTTAGCRVMHIPERVASALRWLRDEQASDRARLGDAYQDNGYVFAAHDGHVLANASMYMWLKRYCEAHGIGFLGLHAFRHFAATQLIRDHVDPRTVADYLGHSKPTTTLNIYASAVAQAKAEAADAIADDLADDLSS